jgi:hypothetical protein
MRRRAGARRDLVNWPMLPAGRRAARAQDVGGWRSMVVLQADQLGAAGAGVEQLTSGPW